MITNTKTYDEEFFKQFSQATAKTATTTNNNNDEDNAIPNPNQMKGRFFAAAFEACQSTIFQEAKTTPELFTMKRNNNNETSNQIQNGGNLIRVIGFVQELDTETSLLDVNPRKFVSNIVAPAAETENQEQVENQNSPLYVECSSAFITPIPGFSYLQENHQNQEEESNTTTTNRSTKRQVLPSSPIQKRGRMENNNEEDLSSANDDDMKTATKKQKRNRTEEQEEEDDSLIEEPQTCPHDGKKQDQKKKKNKITSLAYGDEDSIRKTEKDNIADRSMWKDVLGLSVSPTHETLATGVVGLIPNVQQQQLPQLFNLVELTGFLVNPQEQQEQGGEQQESNHIINIGVGGDNDFDDDGNLMMASRFHNMPDAICPRLLVVGWRILDSVEEAHNETKRQQQEKSKIENQRKEENAVEKEEAQFYKSLHELIESQVFTGTSFSMSATKLLLLHLVSSVTIRNESGAFGDLAIGLDFVTENKNNDNDESNNKKNQQQQEHIAFQNFTAKLTTIIHALRPCSIACNVDYQFDLAQAASNSLSNNFNKNITNNKLSLTHPSSVIARLDYEQQAVSSCLFSLPQGAEMILVVDDVENRFGGASTNDDSSSSTMTKNKKRKVETSVFAPSSINPSSVVSKEFIQQQKAISSYSRNVSVISDLIINQKLPLLFGPGCEVSFERDIGLLFLVRVRQQKNDNNNNQKSQQQNDDKNNKPLGEDAAASATIAKLKQLAGQCDEEQLAETCFGTDMFLPLRCKVTFDDGTTSSENDQTQTQTQTQQKNELERLQSLIIEGTFDKYLARARSLYKSCSPNTPNNGSSSYFADNENNEGDDYFMRTISDLRNMPPHPRNGKVVWWSTSMIKHSVANVLLTMARARACLGGRRLVTKSDIDEVKALLIAMRTE